MQEEWRLVIGFEGIYEVSNFGNVRTLGRTSANGRVLKIRVLRPHLSNGYPAVFLSQDGSIKKIYVHALVTRAFLGERPAGYQVNHKDGNKANSCLSNLEYVTPQENIRHAQLTGLFGKLSIEQVRWVRDFFSKHPRAKVTSVAESIGVSPAIIGNCVKCRTYNLITNSDGSAPSPIEWKRLTPARIIDMQSKGLTLTQISRQLGYEDSAACQVMRRFRLKSFMDS